MVAAAAIVFALLSFASSSLAQSNDPNNATDLSKRGLLYIPTSEPSDYNIFTTSDSPLSWYTTYSTWATLQSNSSLEFVPMIHGTNSVSDDVSAIQSQSSSSDNVLVFNEPDGNISSGGSSITPTDAAKTFVSTILPLRTNHGKKLSLPATTGSSQGLDWLQAFNRSCYALSPHTSGCPFDFVAAHWYGDFAGMTAWLGTLHELYPDKPVWLTEFAIPSASVEATQAMMNQSLPWLDATTWIERYAWFGTFRSNEANEWTGDGVSLLQADGGLTVLGATYLGGDKTGFKQGERVGGSENGVGRMAVAPASVLGYCFNVALLIALGSLLLG
ncbi:hypothetical protein DV737_g2407, partial [Chaetothyriales sp. CBS 132003]